MKTNHKKSREIKKKKKSNQGRKYIFLLLTIAGLTWLVPKVFVKFKDQISFDFAAEKVEIEENTGPSLVLPLASLKPEARLTSLENFANAETRSRDRNRARYLLASDLISQYEGGKAILTLKGLEKDYPELAPHILLKRARAYELTNDVTKATKTWKELIKTYPNSPVAAAALYKLGNYDSQYWDQAIAEFPNHPLTHSIIRKRLENNPDNLDLLLLLARYERTYLTDKIRDRLVLEFPSKLTEDDWQAIADGYWQDGEYRKAADAYSKATPNPNNLYRAGRGLHINGNTGEAKRAYQKLVRQFPDAQETSLGLIRLASITRGGEALDYLDIIIEKFPNRAPAALLQQAKILDRINKKFANQARQKLLDEYPQSEAAAEYRWEVASKYAKSGNLLKAWEWAQPITTNNTDSSFAAKAGFWVGKWASQLGRQEDARAAFQYTITNHFQSYYAWRSAVLLGWDVGNFKNVRKLDPEVIKPEVRSIPPAGSESFKELYLLGLDREAITLFQAEIGNRQELTVEEQFTEALLLLKQGKHRKAINHIWSLQLRESPEEIASWQNLRETSLYWQTLFPFPYNNPIFSWSQERNLNPLLVISLIRQESSFEPQIQSPVGATGLMQLMPATGSWVAQQLQLNDYSLTNPNDNINLGTWYLDHTHDIYNNNSLLAVASYNAGPGNVSKWVRRYNTNDPDLFVEKIPFPETKGYVEAVFSNYWNYLRIYNPEISKLISQYTNQLSIDESIVSNRELTN